MNTVEEVFRSKIFRSATFEGMADDFGFPTEEYFNLYQELATNNVKNIITGCTYISQEGKMVQPGQAGIDSDDMIAHFKRVTAGVHKNDSKLYLQVSHAGRQTSSAVTGKKVVGASDKKSIYFLSKPKPLSTEEIDVIIESFATAALRAKLSDFDGVQIHAAHGYLVHQFLHPGINNRSDRFGISKNTGIGDSLLREIISAIRTKCGESFPILVKVSATDDLPSPLSQSNFIYLIKMLHRERVHAIEISYGTMENALNIFRGESVPLDAIVNYNFRYRKDNLIIRKLWKLTALPILKKSVLKFSENYNLQYSELAKSHTDIPIICVGGFRKGEEILKALETGKTDFVGLCRPFICEPDLVNKLGEYAYYQSKCENCNICAIMCDSGNPTRCYKRKITVGNVPYQQTSNSSDGLLTS